MLNKKYIFFNNLNINNKNIYLIVDKNNFDYIYILSFNKKIIKYLYILNNMYIFFINNTKVIFYLVNKMYKHIFNNILIEDKKYELILHIIGVNYKFYYLDKYNYLIFQLKYSHKIILKLPKLIFCKININKGLIYLYSNNLILLNTIGKLINSFQYINKYKELGINIIKK